MPLIPALERQEAGVSLSLKVAWSLVYRASSRTTRIRLDKPSLNPPPHNFGGKKSKKQNETKLPPSNKEDLQNEYMHRIMSCVVIHIVVMNAVALRIPIFILVLRQLPA